MSAVMTIAENGLTVQSEVRLVGERLIEGYVYVPSQMWRRLTVEVLLEGVVVSTMRSDQFVDKLWRDHRGDGCYGFSYEMPNDREVGTWEVRLSNIDQKLASNLTRTRADVVPWHSGQVIWRGGLRISGFLLANDGNLVTCVCDGIRLCEARAVRWSYVARGVSREAVRSFDFHLPIPLADGTVRSVQIYTENGDELSGSPVHVIAYLDELHEALLQDGVKDRNRARLRALERIYPLAVPFDEWELWSERWLKFPGMPGAPLKCLVIIIGDEEDAVSATVAALDRQDDVQWVAVAIHTYEEKFKSQDLLRCLNEYEGDGVSICFVRAGSQLRPEGLRRLVSEIHNDAEIDLAYADVEYMTRSGSVSICAYPAFDYERLLEQGYFSAIFLVRRAALSSIAPNEKLSVFDVIFSVVESVGSRRGTNVAHVPGAVGMISEPPNANALAVAVQAHLSRVGNRPSLKVHTSADMPRIHVRRTTVGTTASVLVTSSGNVSDIQECLAGLETGTGMEVSRVIIATPSGIETRSPSGVATRFSSNPGEYCRQRSVNLAMEEIETDLVLILDAEVQGLNNEVLAELVSRMADSAVAVAAPIIVDRDQRVLQAGFVIGSQYAAGEAFVGASCDEQVFGDSLGVAHEVSAVSLQCALVRTAMFINVGGFDEFAYPRSLRDVDLCMRFRERMWRNIITPHVKVFKRVHVSLDIQEVMETSSLSLARFRDRWKDRLLLDPFYNPVLGLDGIPFSSFAWPPRALSTRKQSQG